ncbi:cobalamin binding intrinsic factor-like [Synchiropus picturatus]
MLLCVVLLLLLSPGSDSRPGEAQSSHLPIQLSVVNDLGNMTPETYVSTVRQGGVLIGAMRRLNETYPDFRFTVVEHPDYGYWLESVNGVAGKDEDHTYWEILSDVSGEFRPVDLGIGCYIPSAEEHIVLRFSTWS